MYRYQIICYSISDWRYCKPTISPIAYLIADNLITVLFQASLLLGFFLHMGLTICHKSLVSLNGPFKQI